MNKLFHRFKTYLTRDELEHRLCTTALPYFYGAYSREKVIYRIRNKTLYLVYIPIFSYYFHFAKIFRIILWTNSKGELVLFGVWGLLPHHVIPPICAICLFALVTNGLLIAFILLVFFILCYLIQLFICSLLAKKEKQKILPYMAKLLSKEIGDNE